MSEIIPPFHRRALRQYSKINSSKIEYISTGDLNSADSIRAQSHFLLGGFQSYEILTTLSVAILGTHEQINL